MSLKLTVAFPGKLETKTGGYAYDRRMIAGLAELGWTVLPLSLGEGFPFPSAKVKRDAERLLSEHPDGALVVVDGLAFGALDGWAEREARRLNIVALVHHPLALETGLGATREARVFRSEKRALGHARQIIVTSPATARELVARYGVAPGRVAVVVPGTDPAPVSALSGDPVHIVSIGTLTPRKGHDVLLAALKRVEDLPWTATVVGSRTLDAPTAAELDGQLTDLGLGRRVALAGDCEDVRGLLAKADLFALASRYEGYGMVFAEALAQGLPILACRAGAVPEVVPEAAGILVPVDDVDAFAAALRRLLSDPDERRRRAEAARLAGAALPGWREAARALSQELKSLT